MDPSVAGDFLARSGLEGPAATRFRSVRGTVVSVPAPHRIVSSVRQTDAVVLVLVEVEAADGIVGCSYVQGFSRNQAHAICAMLAELGGILHESDTLAVGAAWQRMWAATRLAGHAGIAMFALSAIDTALWDLLGKRCGQPVHTLLGTRHTSLPAYASDGCWLEEDPATVAAQAESFARQGFRWAKVRFGRSDPDQDFAVLDAIGRHVGDGLGLIVDVNQGWSRERAAHQGRRLETYGIEWLEEPLVMEDVEGLADLRRTLRVPITAGESAHGLDGLRALVEQRSVSTLMPDLQRVGGITGWTRASALAEAWNLPITSHLFPEISVHLLAACAAPGPLEWVSWLTPLLLDPLQPECGVVHVPKAPGLGLSFDRDAIRRFALD